MSILNTVTSMIEDFKKRKLWGTLEFEFRNGDLVFVRRKETFVTQPSSEKNSSTVPERTNGTHNEFTRSV